jgi:hypothetical protein
MTNPPLQHLCYCHTKTRLDLWIYIINSVFTSSFSFSEMITFFKEILNNVIFLKSFLTSFHCHFWFYGVDRVMRSRHLILPGILSLYRVYDHTSILGKWSVCLKNIVVLTQTVIFYFTTKLFNLTVKQSKSRTSAKLKCILLIIWVIN